MKKTLYNIGLLALLPLSIAAAAQNGPEEEADNCELGAIIQRLPEIYKGPILYETAEGTIYNNAPINFQFVLDQLAKISDYQTKFPEESSGGTLLSYAAKEHRLPIVELLINKYKHDVNHQDDRGHTPLMLAIIYGRSNVCGQSKPEAYNTIKFLLNNGARTDLKDKFGHTALDFAQYHLSNIIKLLQANTGNR